MLFNSILVVYNFIYCHLYDAIKSYLIYLISVERLDKDSRGKGEVLCHCANSGLFNLREKKVRPSKLNELLR